MYKHASLPGMLLDRTDPLSRGLVGYWPLNEGAGARANNVANKTEGISTNGNLWSGGNSQSAIKFVGTTADYIDVAYTSALDISQAFTAACWLKFTSTGAMIPFARDHTTGRAWAFQLANGRLNPLIFNTGAGSFSAPAGVININDGQWHHAAVTYTYYTNGTSLLTMYADGRFDSSLATAVGPLNMPTNNLQIGRRQYTTAEAAYSGAIHGVRIYTRALSAAEVMQLYINPHAGLLQSRASTFSYLAFRAAWAARANQIIGGSTT